MSETTLPRHADSGAIALRPNVDVLESAEAFRLVVDLPGVDASALAVDLDKNVLRIGGHAGAPGQPGQTVLFERTFTVPADLDADGMTAVLDRGILTVDLPKAAHARVRRIPIEVQ